MKRNSTLLILLILCSMICYGEVSFNYQFSVPLEVGEKPALNIWLADGNGDGQEELFIFYGCYLFGESWLMVEYDLNGDSLAAFNEEASEYIWNSYVSMYESDEMVYLLRTRERYSEIYIICDLLVYNYDSMSLIDSLSVEIGYAIGSGYLFCVDNLNVIDIEGTEYLYLGLTEYNDFYCIQTTNDPFLYKFSFEQGMIELMEEIPEAGTSILCPFGSENLLSIGYSDYANNYEAEFRYTLNSVSFSSPVEVNEILEVEIDYYGDLSMQFISNFDDHYQDYGPVVWESLDNQFHCYSPDLLELLWSAGYSSSWNIQMNASACVNTNMGDNYLMYFYTKYGTDYLEVRNRSTGYVCLNEVSQIKPFKILQKRDGELLFLAENDSLIDVYTLAEEIQLGSKDNEIAANEYNLGNYPNPFNPETVISFDLPVDADVELTIYNIKGQKVKTLTDAYLTAGKHNYLWCGEDAHGSPVSSGIYYYQLKINAQKKIVQKCLLLK
ncbi:MAG: T9SS type A sorting domain-containing protein [Candidatus Cloacimonetes bacterium]|nr:T9SS type A sorting domain-containing protein [Candidatus Cloacimonadota bacterium]